MSELAAQLCAEPPLCVSTQTDAGDAPHNFFHSRAVDAVSQGAAWGALVGLELLKKKQTIPRGEWLPWVAANCNFCDRQARNYMTLASWVWARVAPARIDFQGHGGQGAIALPEWSPSLLPPPHLQVLLSQIQTVTAGAGIKQAIALAVSAAKPPPIETPTLQLVKTHRAAASKGIAFPAKLPRNARSEHVARFHAMWQGASSAFRREFLERIHMEAGDFLKARERREAALAKGKKTT